MSRDLHDTLTHSMLAMLTQIRLIQKLYKSRPELVKEELGHAEKAAQEGLNLAREAVIELRYFAVRDDGLEQAIRKLVKGLKERVEIEVTLEIDDATSKLAGPKMETVYRIVEEALRNVEKHAKADHVIIRIELDQTDPGNHQLKLSIEDNGRGFDQNAPAPGHFGLLGMKEQADILGGKLSITSASAKGTRIQLEVSI
jgi:signal transduction histidine kinase